MQEHYRFEEPLGGIGLVRIYNFDDRCADESVAAIEALMEQGADRIIFDVRNNGGGYAHEMVELLDYLLPQGDLFRTVDYAGRENVDTSDKACLDIPMAVLVNSESYSAAEFFAAALRDYDAAVIVGEQTSGKGYFQNTFKLNDGSAVALSTGKYFTPKGISLEGVGITPDVEIDSPSYSRLVYSLVLGGVIDQYVLKFAREHESIPAVDDFHFSDTDFEDFIEFAKTQEFDYRSSAKTLYDQMKKELEKDGLADAMSAELTALEKALEMDKERFIRLKKDEIIPFIEEEIATRYWYQEAGVKIRLRYDEQLKKALKTKTQF